MKHLVSSKAKVKTKLLKEKVDIVPDKMPENN
jgi:hypothetical protein